MGTMDLFRLDDRIAVVTGGSRGLGKSMAIGLAEAGAHVVIIDRIREKGEETCREIARIGRETEYIQADVTDYEDMGRIAAYVSKRFGRIDILLNNAGVVYNLEETGSASIPLETVSRENWDHVLQVNLHGVFYCTQHIGRVMLKQRSGVIINISSMSAFIGNVGRSNNAYCASKAGVSMFTKQLAGDWAEKGVRVNAIAPGYMKTELGERPMNDPEVKKRLHAMIPMRRPGMPDDLKGIVIFLASDASAYMTGQTVIVDGGYTLW